MDRLQPFAKGTHFLAQVMGNLGSKAGKQVIQKLPNTLAGAPHQDASDDQCGNESHQYKGRIAQAKINLNSHVWLPDCGRRAARARREKTN